MGGLPRESPPLTRKNQQTTPVSSFRCTLSGPDRPAWARHLTPWPGAGRRIRESRAGSSPHGYSPWADDGKRIKVGNRSGGSAVREFPFGESDWLHLSPTHLEERAMTSPLTPMEQARSRTRNVQTFEESRKHSPDLFEVVCVVMGIATALAVTVGLLACSAWIVLMVIGVI